MRTSIKNLPLDRMERCQRVKGKLNLSPSRGFSSLVFALWCFQRDRALCVCGVFLHAAQAAWGLAAARGHSSSGPGSFTFAAAAIGAGLALTAAQQQFGAC